MAMGRVDHESIDASVDERLRAFEAGIADGRGGGNAEAALLVLAGVGVGLALLHVLDGEQADAAAFIVDDDQAFDAVLVQQLAGFGGISAGTDGDDFLGHQFGDRHVLVIREADIAIGDDAEQLARNAFGTGFHNRDAGNLQPLFQHAKLAKRVRRE